MQIWGCLLVLLTVLLTRFIPFVCWVYLNYFSQCYFVEDAVVGEKLFPELEEKYLKDEPLSDAGKLALLKFYANHKELQEEKALVLAKLHDLYCQIETEYDKKEAEASEAYKKVLVMEKYAENYTEEEICKIYNDNEVVQKELQDIRSFMDEIKHAYMQN